VTADFTPPQRYPSLLPHVLSADALMSVSAQDSAGLERDGDGAVTEKKSALKNTASFYLKYAAPRKPSF
jgi:hypothetical protein